MSTKTQTKKPSSIEAEAVAFQELDREIKALQAKQKPLKNALLNYAIEHKGEFDDAFQLKFPNGTYISQRVKDVIEGPDEAKAELMKWDESYAEQKLNEKAVLEAAPNDNHLRKKLTQLGLSIAQKETFAIYAG